MKIGVLGNGQLGAMLALAGHPLGHRFRFFAPGPGAPTAGLGESVFAEYDDTKALREFAEDLDVVTYEFENVDPGTIDSVVKEVPVHPATRALRYSQDRITEKDFFRECGLGTPEYRAVATADDLADAAAAVGTPAVVKSRRFGYDGKGQSVLKTKDEVSSVWQELGEAPHGLILEKFTRFDRELSIVAVRAHNGQTVFYPLVENQHAGGILRLTRAPAPDVPKSLQAKAESMIREILEKTDYVGTLTLELFQTGDELLVNEMAPRVHNSGHWTIEGAVTSQFENHIRAITGAPLGNTDPKGASIMINLIGRFPDKEPLLATEDLHLHDYGKSPRSGRKLGHATICREDMASAEKVLQDVQKRVELGG